MSICSPRRSRPARAARRLVGFGGLVLILGVLGSSPFVALGAGSSPAPAGPPTSQALDPAGFLEALQRGELPGEALAIGVGVAIAAGLLLTLLVAALRSRRRRSRDIPAAPVPETSPAPVAISRSTESWPPEDADAHRDAMLARLDAFDERPTAPEPAITRASMSAPWPSTRLSMADEVEVDAKAEAALMEWPDAPASLREPGMGEDTRTRESVPAGEPDQAPATAPAAPSVPAAPLGLGPRAPEWRMSEVPHEDVSPDTAGVGVPTGLGTPQAPLVVELRSERSSAPGPNLSVVVAIATVAVGVAFAGGAFVGAVLGTTLGATIGVAFAGGAATAIGATVVLLRGRRR